MGKTPPFGNEIIDAVSLFPKYEIEANQASQNSVRVKVTQNNPQFVFPAKSYNEVVLIVGDSDNKVLLFNNTV